MRAREKCSNTTFRMPPFVHVVNGVLRDLGLNFSRSNIFLLRICYKNLRRQRISLADLPRLARPPRRGVALLKCHLELCSDCGWMVTSHTVIYNTIWRMHKRLYVDGDLGVWHRCVHNAVWRMLRGVYGLWLDGDLYHGRTQCCLTYDNDLLTVSEDFMVQYLEIWTFAWR